jgi:pilus assembly protein Flp/PilA
VRAFIAQTLGATAIEYALVAGLISIVILGALSRLSGQMEGLFNSVVASLP